MWQTLRHQWQCRERGGEAIRHIRHSIRAAVRARYSANGRELIKDMCCRPLGSPLPTGSQSIKSVNASSVNNWGDGSQASHHSFDISFVWRQKSDILPPNIYFCTFYFRLVFHRYFCTSPLHFPVTHFRFCRHRLRKMRWGWMPLFKNTGLGSFPFITFFHFSSGQDDKETISNLNMSKEKKDKNHWRNWPNWYLSFFYTYTFWGLKVLHPSVTNSVQIQFHWWWEVILAWQVFWWIRQLGCDVNTKRNGIRTRKKLTCGADIHLETYFSWNIIYLSNIVRTQKLNVRAITTIIITIITIITTIITIERTLLSIPWP